MNRVLIVRLGALGDVVHAIPVAAAIRRAWPTARIDWLVSAKHRAILDLVPVVDRRVAVNDRSGATSGLSLVQAIRELRQNRYDAALDLQGLIKSAILARLSGATRVVGFGPSNVREPLARLFYTSVHQPRTADGSDAGQTHGRHVVHLNLGLLRELGIDPGAAEFPIAPVQSPAAAHIREQTGGKYVLLNPGAAWPNKRWPPARFAEVAVAIRTRLGLASIVLWGPGEREIAEEVAALADGAVQLTPQTSIADVVALARGAALLLSGDTGPLHIGAAVGTPIVGLYGPTRPERNGPWLAEDITVSRAAGCECHHLRRCRRPTMCLLEIDAPEVIEAVERRLSQVTAGG